MSTKLIVRVGGIKGWMKIIAGIGLVFGISQGECSAESLTYDLKSHQPLTQVAAQQKGIVLGQEQGPAYQLAEQKRMQEQIDIINTQLLQMTKDVQAKAATPNDPEHPKLIGLAGYFQIYHR